MFSYSQQSHVHSKDARLHYNYCSCRELGEVFLMMEPEIVKPENFLFLVIIFNRFSEPEKVSPISCIFQAIFRLFLGKKTVNIILIKRINKFLKMGFEKV